MDDGDEDDDEEDDAEVAVDRKRGRKDSKYALKKQERDAKKKKGRVLVEVKLLNNKLQCLFFHLKNMGMI